MDIREKIKLGKTALGIEFGSTRIKAVLVDEQNHVLESGAYDWENKLVNGYWSYSLEEIVKGLQTCYRQLKKRVEEKYKITPTKIGAIGISGMMHGYLALDKEGNLLTPFRTWRNLSAQKGAEILSEKMGVSIPARWSVAHLFQAILDGEEHLNYLAKITTLAGYVHTLLTGENVLGIGEASGMFPLDYQQKNYDGNLAEIFDKLRHGRLSFSIMQLLPRIAVAGNSAGKLTKNGAKLLDIEGDLEAGATFAPPEGDAETGMVATNSICKHTGNVSAGTSIFFMAVLNRPLKRAYSEIDVVATPTGLPVAMVHCNNCTSDLNAWVNLFGEFASLCGANLTTAQLYDLLYFEGEKGEYDCGGVLSYNYVSAEKITKIERGRPIVLRTERSNLTLANFMRAHLYSAIATLKIGCDILLKEEKIPLEKITAHGGLFKTERVGQAMLASALGVPVTVQKTAGEGGAWGMAILANYVKNHANLSLEEYLNREVFHKERGKTLLPDAEIRAGFERYLKGYRDGLSIVREATKLFEEKTC